MPYPRVISDETGGEIVCRDKADFVSRAREFVTERERQQLQRLLYVMSTRAKRTLVLIDDEMLFAAQTRRSGWSAGELLGFFGGENRSTWKALPESTSPLADLPAIESNEVAPISVSLSLPDLSAKDVQEAVEQASRFPRRITPHALAIHSRDEAEPEVAVEQRNRFAAADNPGILYGTWWHEFVQTIPWQKPAAAWQQKFAEAQARSPQPERSAREWDLFRRSTLAHWLAEPGRLIQVEIPFLWREPDATACLEGVMDLAVYTESESLWHVIDWKTNRFGPRGSSGLVEIYRGQIDAYVRALRRDAFRRGEGKPLPHPDRRVGAESTDQRPSGTYS